MLDLSKFPELAHKTVIGIGEIAHGSSGLHRFERLLIESTVKSFGTRLIGLEAPQGVIEKLNEKLSISNKSPLNQKDLAELYSIWRSPQFFELTKSIYEFNHRPANKNDQITMFGFDIRVPFHELNEVQAWTKSKVRTPVELEGIDTAGIRELEMLTYIGKSSEAKQKFDNIAKWLAQIANLPNATKRISHLIARLQAWSKVYILWAATGQNDASYAERDKQLFWLLNQTLVNKPVKSGPVVIVAHLNHLLFNNLNVRNSFSHVVAGPVLGNHIHKEYGDAYSMIGLYSKSIEITQPGGSIEKFEAKEDSLESKLQYSASGLQVLRVSDLPPEFSKWMKVGDLEASENPVLKSYSKYELILNEQMDYVVTADVTDSEALF